MKSLLSILKKIIRAQFKINLLEAPTITLPVHSYRNAA